MRLRWRPAPVRVRLLPAPRVSPPTSRRPEGGRISADKRLFVWHRDQGRCRNCGAEQDLQFDHIVPRSPGGSGTTENVELLWRRNLGKHARLFAPAVSLCQIGHKTAGENEGSWVTGHERVGSHFRLERRRARTGSERKGGK